MKKILVLAMVGCSLLAKAQMKEGRIVYERTIQMPVRMFNNMDPDMAAKIPKSRTDQFELLFGNNQSLWQYLPNANNEDPGTFSSGGVVLRFQGGANEVNYANFEKGVRVDQREVADRSFVVTDSIGKQSWKLTEETKTILNYTVRKATSQRISQRMKVSMENGEMKRESVPDTAQVIAWFTTDIPVPAGPDFQGQLPGVILELDVNKGQQVYKAIEVSPKVNLNKIKEPKDGKKMTAAEFTKEREKIMEEMRRNMPSGNVIRMN
ncbi:MAG TPA: GLPGLI family protein [Flavisolibacter sp.]|jgi:GLPGLI family protein|nr:GLPGLI family protein [Flavisolibacter sp.]